MREPWEQPSNSHRQEDGDLPLAGLLAELLGVEEEPVQAGRTGRATPQSLIPEDFFQAENRVEEEAAPEPGAPVTAFDAGTLEVVEVDSEPAPDVPEMAEALPASSLPFPTSSPALALDAELFELISAEPGLSTGPALQAEAPPDLQPQAEPGPVAAAADIPVIEEARQTVPQPDATPGTISEPSGPAGEVEPRTEAASLEEPCAIETLSVEADEQPVHLESADEPERAPLVEANWGDVTSIVLDEERVLAEAHVEAETGPEAAVEAEPVIEAAELVWPSDMTEPLIWTGVPVQPARDEAEVAETDEDTIAMGEEPVVGAEAHTEPEAPIPASVSPTTSSARQATLATWLALASAKPGALPPNLTELLRRLGGDSVESLSNLADRPVEAQLFERYIVFRLNDTSLALHMTAVREVDRVGRVTPVPGAPAFLSGLINLRGEILPLIDLRVLLGLPGADSPISSRLVVAQSDPGEPPFALLVDELGGIALVDPSDIETDLADVESEFENHVFGVAPHRGRRVLLLDPRTLLSAATLEEVAVA